MTPAAFIFILICLEKHLAQTDTIFRQLEFSPSWKGKTYFILAKPKQSLIMQCLYGDEISTRLYWFKQTQGEKPRLICLYRISSKSWSVYNEFKSNSRFQLHTNNRVANLTITDLESSDTAIYYCAKKYLYIYQFTDGYNVIVEGSGLTSNQSPSESIQSGGSVTLNCTVQAGNCDGDHTVYWFRNSGQSQLGLMYSHGGRKEQCERTTNTCFYSLTLKNQRISHSGSYYCAVAACGRILFGDGTKLDMRHDKDYQGLVDFLCGASAFSTFAVVCLSFFVCKMNRSCSEESDERLSPLSKLEDCLDTDGSVLWEKMKRENAWTECVYYSVNK
uniref:Immune-type receptor 3 n=1 Tax=Sphoeroides nephelus TaxID=39110 RepID=Q9IB07_9TELE|nr:immune-type receptor 3 [Sphoeroides nephelus]